MKKRRTRLAIHRLFSWVMVALLIQLSVDVPGFQTAFGFGEPARVTSAFETERVQERVTEPRKPVYAPLPDAPDSDESSGLSTGEDDFFPQSFILSLPRFDGRPVASPAAFRVRFSERIFRDIIPPPPRQFC